MCFKINTTLSGPWTNHYHYLIKAKRAQLNLNLKNMYWMTEKKSVVYRRQAILSEADLDLLNQFGGSATVYNIEIKQTL